MSEDDLRRKRFEAYIMKERMLSEYSMSSGVTRVGSEDEFGYLDPYMTLQSKQNAPNDTTFKGRDPSWGNTLVGIPEEESTYSSPVKLSFQQRLSKEQPLLPNKKPVARGGPDAQHQRQPSQDPSRKHLSTDQPLEAYQDFVAGGGNNQWVSDRWTEETFDPYREVTGIPADEWQQSAAQPIISYLPRGHQRTASDLDDAQQDVTSPLLAYSPPVHTRSLSIPRVDEFGALQDVDGATQEGGGTMAGIGTVYGKQ
jgi:hypothetical protein